MLVSTHLYRSAWMPFFKEYSIQNPLVAVLYKCLEIQKGRFLGTHTGWRAGTFPDGKYRECPDGKDSSSAV
jgi:hypothetical protein